MNKLSLYGPTVSRAVSTQLRRQYTIDHGSLLEAARDIRDNMRGIGNNATREARKLMREATDEQKERNHNWKLSFTKAAHKAPRVAKVAKK